MSFLNWYLKPKSIEAEGRLYEKLGIDIFKKITPFELIGSIKNRKIKSLKKSNQNGLKKYFRDTVAGEIAHLFSFVFLLSIAFFFIFENLYGYSIILLLINILVNLYPIFLMRYNRFRIAKVLNKQITELLNEK